MRKLLVSNVMSLDGFFEGSRQEIDWFPRDEEFFLYARRMLRSVDTILFGRKTYEHMAAYWPSAPPDEIAEKMNGLAKIVFSSSMTTAAWHNSTLVSGDAAQEVARLKQSPGGDMVILGSAKLASSLLRAGLIDEYRVILSPIILGSGTPLFADIREKLPLSLHEIERLSSGVLVLYYWPT
jgi:dihydrofolate reductase